MPSSLPRLDVPAVSGLGGALFRLRWSLAGEEGRFRELSRTLWSPDSWEDEDSTARSLIRMRTLVDMGVLRRDNLDDALARAFSAKAYDTQRSLLGWDAMRAIRDRLPVAAVHLLLDAGAPVDFRESNNYSDSLLTCAVRSGNVPALRLLVQAGASVDLVDTCDTTPLRQAVQRKRHSNHPGDAQERLALEMIDILLEAGAAVDHAALYFEPNSHKDLPATPLLEAACAGWQEGVEKFLSAGARLDRVGSVSGASFAQSWVEDAVHWNDYPTGKRGQHFNHMLDRLMGAGMPIDLPAHDGTTAFHVAAVAGKFDLALALLDRGASIANGPTPLSHALIGQGGPDDEEVRAFLSRMPADFWAARDAEGLTAFEHLDRKRSNGSLRDFEGRWLSFLAAHQLSEGTAQPAPSKRPRARL